MELRNRAAAGEGTRESRTVLPPTAAGWSPGVLLMADGLGPDQSLHAEAAPVHWADGVLPGGDQGERPRRVPAGERAGGPSSNSMATSQTSQGSRKVPPRGLQLSRLSCAQ